MAKENNTIDVFGEITEALGNSRFNVTLDNKVELKNCAISGKIRKNYIRLLPGDRVRVALSVYDLTTGRIEERLNLSKPSSQVQQPKKRPVQQRNRKKKK